VKVQITAYGAAKALLKPGEFLGSDLWPKYLTACKAAGGTYDAGKKAQVIDAGNVGIAIEQLALAGFEPVVETKLAEQVRSMAREIQQAVDGAKDRLEALNEQLKKRGLELFPFQRSGVQWLASRRAGILADEMGLGKTIQTLAALPAKAPVVAVCPASLKHSVWKREAGIWRPDLKPFVCSGRGSFMWPTEGEMAVINYDILPTEESLDKTPACMDDMFSQRHVVCQQGTILLADEAHALKNRKASRTANFRALAKRVREANGRVWLLTGTPLLNRPQELWTLLEVAGVAAEAFGTFYNFVRLLGGNKTSFGIQWGGKVDAQVPDLLKRVMLHRRRTEVLPDLPKKIWNDVKVELSAEAKSVADAAIDKLRQATGQDLEDGEIDVTKIASVAFEELSAARAALAKAKIPALLEQIEVFEDNEEPVIVFSYHRAAIDQLAQRPGWAVITGDTPPEQRQQIVTEFQGGRLKGVAGTIQAAGTGLTLTRANQAIFVDLAWTPALNAQAEDRICRIGQTRGVIITRLIAEHILDERVAELLLEKQKLIESAVEKASVVNAEIKLDHAAALDKAHVTDNPAAVRSSGRRPAAAAGPRSLVSTLPGTPTPPNVTTGRREALDAVEKWASRALLTLAALDQDHARQQNGVGFSRLDNDFGHSLAKQISDSGKLSDKQWVYAVRLAKKYQRQVGAPPIQQEAR
jgi:SWI/SNF-related matrix-associated actin-dependent regulator 1 of chromatin subfamily A